MFAETFALKRDGLRGKKLAKSMAEKVSSYSADELRLLAELVPSPELRARASAVHYGLLALLGIGSLLAAGSAYQLFAAGDRTIQGLALAGVVLLFRFIAITMIARYRRDGALLVFLGVSTGLVRQISTMDVLNLAFTVALAIVTWLWLVKLFPKLKWRGRLPPRE